MATSLSSSQSARVSYDVYLSFREEDTRKTFVDHLYSALVQRLIRAYIDDDETLPRGVSISQSLLKAIKQSHIAVIIFSKNYADSSRCLDELEYIMKCKDETGLIVMPVFYDVEPSEVREQKGDFGKGFAKQEANNIPKIDSWRRTLVDASNLSGWEPKNVANGSRLSIFLDQKTQDFTDSKPTMASSSSSSRSAPASYDVFLSFKGEDTRKTFVDHLYSALQQRLIYTYKDDETLPRGVSIGPSLFNAIKQSHIAVIVFSKNYANSSWCLDELEYIIKCKDEAGVIVMPVFYDVDPSEVREQKGDFGKAFAKQEANNTTKVESWRKALVDASNLPGWEPKNVANGHEAKVIKEIAETILDRLSDIDDGQLVGMRTRLQEKIARLQMGSVMHRWLGYGGLVAVTRLTSVISLRVATLFERSQTNMFFFFKKLFLKT